MTGYQSKKAAAQDKLDSREREALKLALDALEGFIPYLPLWDKNQCNRYDLATTAIKAALAQPAQEPVAWQLWVGADTPPNAPMGWQFYSTYNSKKSAEVSARTINSYQQAPFAKLVPLYTTPPQRPWVGLTEEDFSAINQSCFTKLQAATSAESILKEKNNG